MNIIAKSATVTNAQALYNLTQSPDRKKLTEAKGKTLKLSSWVLYTDVDMKGNEVTLLSLIDENGHGYCTNSATFCRDFKSAVDMFAQFGEEFTTIEVSTGTSKNNREYISCKVIE